MRPYPATLHELGFGLPEGSSYQSPCRTSFIRAILVKVPFPLSAPLISDRGPFDSFIRIPTEMFALNGRLPTSLHLPHHGDCRLSRSLSRSVNRHCRRPRTRVLQCSAESALTAEDFERMLNKILKPIQDDVGAVKDDLRAVKVWQIICFR